MPRRDDITGQRFGRLLVAAYAETRSGVARWSCVCDCGGTIVTSAALLKRGGTSSCGCLHRERLRERRTPPPIGERFGRLVVLRVAAARRLVCVCDCGTETEVAESKLKSGQTRSCGCLRRVDLAGQRFGRLVAIEPAERSESGALRWHMRCDCGRDKVVLQTSLLAGRTTSCGCAAWETWRAATSLDGRRFGRLTVLADSGARAANGERLWAVSCDCGNGHVVRRSSLLAEATATCGCSGVGTSQAERDVFEVVKALAPDACQHVRLDDSRMEWDVVVPSRRLAVEFNGTVWHSSRFKTDKRYHLRKRLAAEAAGYRQVTVWQDDWTMRRGRMEALLRRALGGEPLRRIGARVLDVREVPAELARKHHAAHHVQGGRVPGGLHLALCDGEAPLAVATFQHRARDVLLTRYTVAGGVSVPGGLSRLVSAEGGTVPVVTYADRDHFDGRVYEAAGFVRAGTTLQLTYLEGAVRVRRERFMRHKLPGLGIAVADGETEREALERAGVFQCWNSGVEKWCLRRG